MPESCTCPTSICILGAAYLKQMLARYDSDLPLVLSAYNAGPSRANRWRHFPEAADPCAVRRTHPLSGNEGVREGDHEEPSHVHPSLLRKRRCIPRKQRCFPRGVVGGPLAVALLRLRVRRLALRAPRRFPGRRDVSWGREMGASSRCSTGVTSCARHAGALLQRRIERAEGRSWVELGVSLLLGASTQFVERVTKVLVTMRHSEPSL